MNQRIFAIVLTLALLLGLCPVSVWAVEAEDVPAVELEKEPEAEDIKLTSASDTGEWISVTGIENGQICFDSSTGTITDCETSVTVADIPEKINGVSVTSIGNCAFCYCTSLTSITLPNSVTSIGEDAFYYCTSLTNITIPNSVTSIGEGAFCSCASLPSIQVASENLNYSSLNGVLFNKLQTDLVAYPEGKSATNYSIPNSVTSIGDRAFYNCTSLTSIIIPNSVTSIGEGAFSFCTSLTSITIPNSVTSIGGTAFFYCTSLTSITIPNSVTSIGDWAFYYCRRLTSITIPNSVTSIEYQAFYNCASLTSVTIPGSVTSIRAGAFYDCTSLTSITIPNSVTSIGYRAFYDCTNLKDVYYTGSAEQWSKISMDSYNSCLTSATIHYNSSGPISYPCQTYSNVTFQYVSSNSGAKTMDGLSFKDEWLFADSYTYNHELATMALGFAMAGFEDDSGNYAKSKKDSYIKALYGSLGFATEGNAYYSVGYGTEDDDTVAMAISSKSLTNSDGDTVTLMVVTLRGAGYGDGGWAGDFEVGAGTTHTGFNKAALFAKKRVKSYIETNGIDKKSVRILLTGYSRSAATANLLSASLRSAGLCSGDHIYTYTFATPSNQMVQNFSSAYDNIFNIVSPADIVPQVPLVRWNFGKQGTTLNLPVSWYKKDSEIFQNAASRFQTYSGAEYDVGYSQDTTVFYLCDLTANIIPDSKNYTETLQTPLILLLSEKSSEKLNQLLFCDNFTVDEMKTLIQNKQYLSCYLKLTNLPKDQMLTNSKFSFRFLSEVAAISLLALKESVFDDPEPVNQRLLEMIADVFDSDRISSSLLFKQHWPENYMAWMRTKELDPNTAYTNDYKIAKVSCPVDVEVYDAENNLVGRTKTESFTVEGETYTVSVVDEDVTTLDAVVIGENKIFVLPDDQNYRMEIQTNETYQDGDTMSIQVTDYSNGNLVGTTEYKDLPLKENTKFSGTIGETSEGGLSSCSLETEGVKLESTSTHYPVHDSSSSPSMEDVKNTEYKDLPLKENTTFTGITSKKNEDGLSSYSLEKEGSKLESTSTHYPVHDSNSSLSMADVKTTDWFYDAVQYVTQKGLMNGISEMKFDPNGTTTRAMFITTLWRAAGSPEVAGSVPFTDVQQGMWYTEAIRWGVSIGVVKGMTETTFSPDSNVTRESLATMIYRYEQSLGNVSDSEWMSQLSQQDAAKISDWANEGMHWCIAKHIVNGDEKNNLNPQKNTSRAELATILMNWNRSTT